MSTSQAELEEIAQLVMKQPPERRRFYKEFARYIQTNTVTSAKFRGGTAIMCATGSEEFVTLKVGNIMEKTDALLRTTNEEVTESKTILAELAEECGKLSDVVHPALLGMVKDLRASRMAAVAEVRETLSSLRDIRKFFLESDYETEMARLERLVALCKEIQALKQSGVFDAVCDSALKLAVGR